MIYGYCRISKPTQDIERQVRNILEKYPNAKIYKEAYTGTRIDGRADFNKLLTAAQSGDTIVFDSVSRMSRNADDGVNLYMQLYIKGINLVFLKEPYINTSTYQKALEQHLDPTGNEIADLYIEATNQALQIIASEQVRIAFNQAEKEVIDLHKRTSEGVRTAKLNGKTVGRSKGIKISTQKSTAAKAVIKKYSVTFGGSLADKDILAMLSGMTYEHKVGANVMNKSLKISRNSYYTYKKQLVEEYNSKS